MSETAKFKVGSIVVSGLCAIALASCSTVTTTEYEATARTTYTWQVEYATNPSKDGLTRFETFASASLLNRNGIKPANAVKGPDERGLWWGALPPRPSVDEIEQRQKFVEKPSTPQLIKSVDYQISYQAGDGKRTLPTNYQAYRQVVKAYSQKLPLQLTLGVNDNTVEKAEVKIN
ncbi:hypothetical protein [Aliterella atlantica]|uniref:Lipoprotein n=1 Tax=Aliterella atlantica CENA595 TaxID=1618023 RepID=A0A0D8ZQZ8_9CYAN|nr:hypothetical protein [Aliterella atlantica]KJH70924.1 hypothetical protein UH38_15130 [Aliterella atlantica CENA595]